MVDVRKFSEIDLYGMLGIEITATESEVDFNSYFPPFRLICRQNSNNLFLSDQKSIPKESIGLPSGQESRQSKGG